MCFYRLICLLSVLVVFSPKVVFSANHYVCDCASEADNECTPGNDNNTGTDADNPKQSYEQARATFSNISAGDAVLFCHGGAWDISSGQESWVNSTCLANNRCHIGAYLPPWATGDELRPKLRRLDVANGMSFANGGDGRHQEGYVISDLHLVGTSTSNFFGLFFYNDIDDVEIINVKVEGFGVGVHLAGSNPCDPNDNQCDGQNSNIDLSDSLIINNRSQGWLGASDDSSIINSKFFNNGSQFNFDHNIYLGGHSSDMVVKNNHLKYSALDNNGVCQGASMVAHGGHHNMLIEGNLVEEDINLAGQGCWGIVVDAAYNYDEIFTQITIRNNTVRNVGNVSVGISSCQNCVIENNVVEQSQATGGWGIVAPNRMTIGGDAITTDVSIRNNTIFLGTNFSGTGIGIINEGMNHQIISNVIYYAGNHAGFNCLSSNLSTTAFTEIDHNLCFYPNAANAEWMEGFVDLPAWQNSSGFDGNSLTIDPEFNDINGSDFSAASAMSPVVDSGHSTLSSPSGINAIRDQNPDMGAFEFVFDDLIFVHGFEL
jgi:hypothetical protein